MQERRHFPRYSLDQAVLLVASDSAHHAARTVDISMLGIGLHVARPAAEALAQSGRVVTPGDRFQAMFVAEDGLPLAQDLTLECRVRHARRLSLEQYFVGAVFEQLSTMHRDAIAALIQFASITGPR